MQTEKTTAVNLRGMGLASSLLPQLLVTLGVAVLYFAVASWVLPAGVNRDFTTRSLKVLIPAAALLLGGCIVYWHSKGGRPKLFEGKGEEFSRASFILLLLPLTPVVQYIIHNFEILSWAEAVLTGLYFVLVLSFPILFVPHLLSRSGAFQGLTALGLAFSFTLTQMASLSSQFAWHEAGDTVVQLSFFALVWLVSWLLLRLNMRQILYLAAAGFFVANTVFQLSLRGKMPRASETDQSKHALAVLVGGRRPASTPNIYLLIYDAYVASETMEAYGIDNRAQEQYLEEQGFELYPETYSVGGFSIETMSRVLNASLETYGEDRRGVSGDGVVHNLLKRYGYETYGIFTSDFFYRGIIPRYDHSFPDSGSSANLMVMAIWEGEFRFDLEFDKMPREQYVREKNRVLSQEGGRPKFVYTHNNLPGHSQNSGVCLADETERYRERLERANREMKRDLELINAHDPGAIVIVAGDHGPYLTKNCTSTQGAYPSSEIERLDLQDRYGTFLAIRWPAGGYEAYDDIRVLQDLFPAVFAYLFEDAGLLEAKVEASTINPAISSDVRVVDGVIRGGVHDGEPLFLNGAVR